MQNLVGNKKGTSLVEVLVVMVVLLIGIMTVIQMFPTGFRVVRAGESRTIATRLAQQELDRWKSMAANLPTGILPIDENEPPNVYNEQLSGPPFEAFLKDANGDWIKIGNRYARGNVLNIRMVHGETTTIPVGSYFQAGGSTLYGSRYTLAFGPIEVSRDTDEKLLGLAIRSGDLRRVKGDGDSDPPYLQPGNYAVDYQIRTDADGPYFQVAFPKDPGVVNRVYYVSYSYWASTDPNDPNVQPEFFSSLNVEVNVPGKDGGWQQVPIKMQPNYELVDLEEYSDTCCRGFVEQPEDWTKDPYEFKLADPILGVIAFNPAGHKVHEYTARGIRPLEARIDYRIYDLRIMREDRTVPNPRGDEIPIKLSLRFILDAGNPENLYDGTPTDNPDESTFEGLVKDIDGSLIVPYSMLIIDLSTGLRVDMTNVEIDFNAGIVTLPRTADLIDYTGDPQAEDVPLARRHLRFFYRADGDWSVQCQKAYSNYTRVTGGGTPNFQSFKLVQASDASNEPAKRLWFAPCDAGKTVLVDLTYGPPTSAASVEGERRIVGLSCYIDENNRETATNGIFYYVDLPVPPGDEIKRVSVVGTSFRVRVIWRDGANWRHVDMDTNLVRGSGNE